MDTLGKLLGSPARVKIMRLFLLNRETVFAAPDIAKRARVSSLAARKELNLLKAVGFARKKVKGWFLNSNFPQLELWRVLLVGSEIMKKEDIIGRFKGAGRIKFLAVAGVFLGEPEARVDLLIVGDAIRKDKIDAAVKSVEAELGRELSYACFETKEFLYRLNMYDKLIFDILDRPHERIIEAREFSELSTLPFKKS